MNTCVPQGSCLWWRTSGPRMTWVTPSVTTCGRETGWSTTSPTDCWPRERLWRRWSYLTSFPYHSEWLCAIEQCVRRRQLYINYVSKVSTVTCFKPFPPIRIACQCCFRQKNWCLLKCLLPRAGYIPMSKMSLKDMFAIVVLLLFSQAANSSIVVEAKAAIEFQLTWEGVTIPSQWETQWYWDVRNWDGHVTIWRDTTISLALFFFTSREFLNIYIYLRCISYCIQYTYCSMLLNLLNTAEEQHFVFQIDSEIQQVTPWLRDD